jgi:septum formation protein
MEVLCPEHLRIIPAVGEERADPSLPPDALVKVLSRHKAKESAARCAATEDAVIGADTGVALDGQVLGKPKDASDAKRMLRALSGRTHSVFTGVTVICGGQTLCHAERTEVTFRALEDGEIDRYILTGEPMDKAGAYGAQGWASLFVEKLDGDFFNVMGLPLCALGKLLKQLGVNLL